MTDDHTQGILSIAQRLETSIDRSDPLVRIEETPKFSGYHILANRSGMRALGLECLKASAGHSIDTKKKLPLEPKSLSYLRGSDEMRITGLFVDDGIEYEKRLTEEEVPTLDSGFRILDRVFTLVIWLMLGLSGLGFVVLIRWIWRLVN